MLKFTERTDPGIQFFTEDAYWMLELKSQGEYGYRYGTHQGERLAAYATEPTFLAAWQEALMATVIGWDTIEMIKEWEAQPRDADPGTEPDSPVYDGPFDPYAGNLDSYFEARAEIEDYGFDYSWE